MPDFAERRWKQVWDAVIRDGGLFESSYRTFSLWKRQMIYVAKYGQGVTLDLGAGKLPFRPALAQHAGLYISMDIECEHPDLDIIGSGEGLPLASQSIDTVFSAQVMEHVPHPWRFVGEIARVLKPDGILILSVPFVFYIHGEPHDYFRYTPYALRSLLEENGFRLLQIETVGGLWAFVAYFIQTGLIGATYGIPLIGPLCWQANRLITALVGPLDHRLGVAQHFPMNVLVVARIRASHWEESCNT